MRWGSLCLRATRRSSGHIHRAVHILVRVRAARWHTATGQRRTVSSVYFGASYKSASKVEQRHRRHSVNLAGVVFCALGRARTGDPSGTSNPQALPTELQGRIALTGYVAGLRLCLRAVAGREARRWERRRKWKGAGGIRPHAPIVAYGPVITPPNGVMYKMFLRYV